MKTAVLVLTPAGLALAHRLRAERPGDTVIFGPACVVASCVRKAAGEATANVIVAGTFSTGEAGVFGWRGPLRRVIPLVWEQFDAIVAIMALGIVVRLVAPLARDKRLDPAVVVVDDAGRFAISVLGGHGARANELARAAARTLGAQAVITTASDVRGLPALDEIARQLDWTIERTENLTHVAASIVRLERIAVWQEAGPLEWWTAFGSWPKTFVRLDDWRLWRSAGAAALVVISDRCLPPDLPAERTVVYRPPTLVAGVGCRRGVAHEIIDAFVASVFAEHGLAMASLGCVATVTLKAREPGLLAFAGKRRVPLVAFPPADLARHPGIERPSARVRSLIGIASVAEPAAMRAAGADRLLIAKEVGPGVTVAVARRNAFLVPRPTS